MLQRGLCHEHSVLKASLLEAEKQECLEEAVALVFHSGKEDMPDAFRSMPVRREDLRHNNVPIKCPVTKKVLVIAMYGALFGEGSSVFSFGRWSAFLEAAPRRVLWML